MYTNHMYTTSTRESQILLLFPLRALVIQTIKALGFFVGNNGEFESPPKKKIAKTQKLKSSNRSFVPNGLKIQEKFQNFWL